MSFTQLPLIEVDMLPPSQPLVEAQWLSSQIDAAREQRQAHHQAALILKSARRKAEQVMRDAYRSQHQMEADMTDEMERLRKITLENSEAEWLATHVNYLLEGEKMYQTWIDEVAKQIHVSIEKVLTAWFDEQPRDPTLCHRLAKQAQQMAKEGSLTLRVHPEQLAKVRETFGERFTLVAEPDFAPDQAELSSLLLSVEFSLSKHFQQLLLWLRQAEPTLGEADGDQNP